MDGTRLQSRMVAARIARPGVVEVVNPPLPEPGPGEVRVRIEGCGVCASNLGPWAGPDWMEFPLPPGDLGHEAWGHIDAVGAGVPRDRLEERVAVFGTRGFASHEVVPQDAALPVPPALVRPLVFLISHAHGEQAKLPFALGALSHQRNTEADKPALHALPAHPAPHPTWNHFTSRENCRIYFAN